MARGLAGLGNLGNTCFMNSSLQCLSHAAPLARMFLSGAYRQDINKDNPLGNRGELAEAFGMLLKLLWQARGSSPAPPFALQPHLFTGPSCDGLPCACSPEALGLISRPASVLLHGRAFPDDPGPPSRQHPVPHPRRV